MKISVIIPTRDRPDEVVGLLDALESQTRRPDEVVIVDSGRPSLRESSAALRLTSKSFEIKHVPSAPGACRQRNLGARRSSGDVLIFFDDDVRPARDFIAIMARTLSEHPEYAGGMGAAPPAAGPWSPASILARIFLLQREHGDGRFGWSGWARYPYGTRQFRDTEVLASGMLAVRRSVFAHDGIEFDERLTLSQQDDDFSRRLSRRHRLFFSPDATIEHRFSPRGRASAFEQGRRYMFNYRYLYFKNFYPYARWTLPAHWWAVLGTSVAAATLGSTGFFRGCVEGLLEFERMQQGRSQGLFEPSSGTVESRP